MINDEMKSYEEAITLINKHTKILDNEIINIKDAQNRIVATDVIAKISNPNFRHSAVDGIAITYETLELLKEKPNTVLSVKKIILAGDATDTDFTLQINECLHIMTGAMLPKCINTIFFIEQTKQLDDVNIVVNADLLDNQNIRIIGEDYNVGEILIKAGIKLNATRIALLVSAGVSELQVFKKPKVAIFTTGKEVIDISEQIVSGKIYNSNIILMEQFLHSLGFEVIKLSNVNDNMIELENNVRLAIEQSVDIIVSSGAVSMGIEDIVKNYLLINSTIIYNSLKIRPGKPNMLGMIDNTLYFGLPGNPISCAVALYCFVGSYYRFANNLTHLESSKAVLTNTFTKKLGWTFLTRGYCSINADGMQEVTILPKQGSHVMSTLAQANCLVKLQESKEHFNDNNCNTNDIVEIFKFYE